MGVVVMLHVGSHSGPSGRIVEDRVQRAKEGQKSSERTNIEGEEERRRQPEDFA